MKLRFYSTTKRKQAILRRSYKRAVYYLRRRYKKIYTKDLIIKFVDSAQDSYQDKELVVICVHSNYTSYKLQRCKLKTPKNGIDVGVELNVTLLIIHEIVHYIQYKEKRRQSEVETTQAEIDYLYENARHVYNKLVPVRKK